MIKVIIAIVMFTFMAVSIARADDQPKYGDGNYTGESAMMKVEVEIEDGAMM